MSSEDEIDGVDDKLMSVECTGKNFLLGKPFKLVRRGWIMIKQLCCKKALRSKTVSANRKTIVYDLLYWKADFTYGMST